MPTVDKDQLNPLNLYKFADAYQDHPNNKNYTLPLDIPSRTFKPVDEFGDNKVVPKKLMELYLEEYSISESTHDIINVIELNVEDKSVEPVFLYS